MKKILFVLIHADMGGIEKSFICLMKELSKDPNLKIDVFLFCHKGVFLDEIKKYCYVYPEEKALRLIGISQVEAWKESKLKGMQRLVLGFIAKYLSRSIAYKLTLLKVPELLSYDIAISYMHNKTRSLYGGTNEFVLNKVNAIRKVTFIHADLINANINIPYNYKIYQNFDRIINVSESCKQLMDNEWPELMKKSFVVHNMCNVDEILKLSSDNIEDLFDTKLINLVTVARMDSVKGIDRSIRVFSRIRNKVLPFHWIIVGGGELMHEYKILAEKLDVSDIITFVGGRTNPYPYVKKADLLYLASYQEAAPIVFLESNCLGVPILSTNTVSAIELVEDKNAGIVCDNTEDAIEKMLINTLNNREVILEMKNKLKRKTDNSVELREFYKSILE